MGEKEDPETGLHHMAHALANAMFLYCHDGIKPVEISDIEDV